MPTDPFRAWLQQLEADLSAGPSAEAVVSIAYAAGRDVRLDEQERAAAIRRSLLIVAAGGDPHRALGLDDRGVITLATDLDSPARRAELAAGLAQLDERAADLPGAHALLAVLAADGDLAWRAYACALLAEELGDAA